MNFLFRIMMAHILLAMSFSFAFAEDTVCFPANNSYQVKLIRNTFDQPKGDIILNIPKEVALGSEYTLSGRWGTTYDYTTGVYIVTAGWVNDESDTSANFWTTGYYDKKIFDERNMEHARTFSHKITLPKDDEAKNHQALKVQVTVSATGANTKFYLSYVYRIPLSSTIKGGAQSIDIDLPTCQYIKTPLFGTKAKAVLLQGNSVYTSEDLKEPYCYTLSADTAEGPFNLRIYDMGGAGEDLFTRTIENMPSAARITTWLPRGLYNKNYVQLDRLNKVDVTASYIFGLLEMKLPIAYTYSLLDVRDVLSDFKAFTGPYDSLMYGSQVDSLRADYLTRLIMAEIATDSIYKQVLRITGESGKALTALASTFLLKDELDFIAGTAGNNVYTKEIAASLSYMIAQVVAQIYDWTIATAPDLKKESRVNLNALYKYISAEVNSKFAKEGKGHLALWKTLVDNTFESTVVLASVQMFMPFYVALSEDNLNDLVKYHKSQNYYPFSELVKESNIYAYNKTINMSDNNPYECRVKKYTNITTDNVNASIGYRKMFGILSAIEKCKELGTGALLGKLFASKILKVLNVAPLALALLQDGAVLLEAPVEHDYCVQKVFDPDLGYFHRKSYGKVLKETNEIKAKKLEIVDNLKNQINKYDLMFSNKLNDLLTAVNTNNKTQIGANLLDLIHLADSSMQTNKLINDYISAIADTIYRKDSTFAFTYANFLEKQFHNNLDKQIIFEEAYKIYEELEGASVDSLIAQTNYFNNVNSILKDTSFKIIELISDFPLSAFISITNLTKNDTLVKQNQNVKLRFKIENLGALDCDSVSVILETDDFAVVTQDKEIFFDKVAVNESKLLEWDIAVADSTKFALTYKLNISSNNTLPKSCVGMFKLDGKAAPVKVEGDEIVQFKNIVLNSISPNPASEIFYLDLTVNKSDNIKITLYNILGEKISDLTNETITEGDYQFSFPTSNLMSGIYYIKIESGKNQIIEKVIINR